MNGEDLFRGLCYVNAKFIDEAETVTQLKSESAVDLAKVDYVLLPDGTKLVMPS